MTDSRTTTELDTESTSTTSTGSSSSRRQRAIEAYGSARENATRRATDTVDQAPLAVLAAGLAAGAAIAALLPRTRAEDKLLRPVTDRARQTARSAYDAAKDAGRGRLNELGLTTERGSDAVRSIVEGATEAAKVSAQAAFSTVRKGE